MICLVRPGQRHSHLRPKAYAGHCGVGLISISDRVLIKLIEEKQLESVFDILNQQGIPISRDIVYSLLQRCLKKKDLVAARKVHALMVSNMLDSIPVLGDHLIRLFTSCGSLSEANEVFHKVSKPTVYTWNAIIQAHANLGDGNRALQLYQVMQEDGLKPEKHTFSSVLKACTSIGSLGEGRFIHDQISRSGVELDVAVGNALVDLYAKCGSLEEAHRVFDNLLDRNVVSWAALISGYVQHGQGFVSYDLFQEMQMEGIKPDKVIFLCALKACGSMGAIEQGRLIHEQLIKTGLESDTMIGNALVDMYGKCGGLEEANVSFDRLVSRDVVTWGALISGYAQCGDGSSALKMFSKMQLEGLKPDQLVFSSIVKACGSLGVLGQGRLVYDQIIIAGLESDVVVGSTLIDMYTKCGSLDEAQKVFDKLPQHDVVSWGAMIAAWLEHGDTCSAFEHFDRMLMEGLVPEKATMLCIIKACGSIGAFEQVRKVHDQVIRGGLESEVTIGNSIVDVYAKCGSLEEACQVFSKLPIKTVVSWGALITAYAKGGKWRLALEWFEDFKSQGIKPDDAIFLGVLISCGHAGLLKEGRLYFKSMKDDHGITPNIEHYNCLVDILGRAGLLLEAEDLLKSIPLGMDIIGWMSLLTGCKTYGNMEVGKRCYEQIKRLDPGHASGYVLISSLYANAHLWSNASEMQELKRCSGMHKYYEKHVVAGSHMSCLLSADSADCASFQDVMNCLLSDGQESKPP